MKPAARAALLLTLAWLPVACGDDDGSRGEAGTDAAAPPPDAPPAVDAGSDAAACVPGPGIPSLAPARSADSPPFPEGFFFGSASAAYQIEGGNHNADWYRWEQLGHIVGGDSADDGPDLGNPDRYRADLDRMQADGLTMYRISIEWSRIFPTRESFDAEPMRPDAAALAYYHDLLSQMRMRGIEPMVTLHHFSSPTWWVDPGASVEERSMTGWASPRAVEDFTRWASFAAREFGGEVDYWNTINEPLVYALTGYVAGATPPGLMLALDLLPTVLHNIAYGSAAASRALHEIDTIDAGGDASEPALVSIAKHQRVFFPKNACSARDVAAAAQVHYVFDVLLLDALVRGDLDANADGDLSDPEDVRADPMLRGSLDFLGINYYGDATVDGGVRLSDVITGVPSWEDLATDLPKTDAGWDVFPEGLRTLLDEAAPYGLPIFITENGIADRDGDQRGRYVVDHLGVIADAIADGIDVRGYLHWSYTDNFEWVSGFCPRFGLYRVDYGSADRPRTATPGAEALRDIVENRRVTAALASRYPRYGTSERCTTR